MTLGFPSALLGEQYVFGGVITKVSDTESVKMGGLKLTDLPAIHVKPLLSNVDGAPVVVLVGCVEDCTEDSARDALVPIPIVGVDEANDLLILDIAKLGEGLDLVSMLDPDGSYTGLAAIASQTTAMDYSLSTLVFDVETRFSPLPTAAPAGGSPTPAPSASPSPALVLEARLGLRSFVRLPRAHSGRGILRNRARS
jgi:hypothetical protein